MGFTRLTFSVCISLHLSTDDIALIISLWYSLIMDFLSNLVEKLGFEINKSHVAVALTFKHQVYQIKCRILSGWSDL